MSKDKLRPTAQEYLQQMKELQNQMFKLDMIVVTRLYTLCASHPQVPIQVLIDDNDTFEIKAKSLIPANRGKGIIKDLPYEVRIQYIETIEKWLADKHPHKQKEIEFKEEPKKDNINFNLRHFI
jgi:hypothetical protein